MIASLKDQLIRDEELRQKPYLDCCGRYWRDCTCQKKGKLTGGVGRNLDDVGFSLQEIYVLLTNDINAATVAVEANFPWAMELDDVRKGAMVNLTFNLGVRGLSGFAKFLAAMKSGDWKTAKEELIDSAADHEEPARISRLALQIESGFWQ